MHPFFLEAQAKEKLDRYIREAADERLLHEIAESAASDGTAKRAHSNSRGDGFWRALGRALGLLPPRVNQR